MYSGKYCGEMESNNQAKHVEIFQYKQHGVKYIDILSNLITKYNNTFHRSIKCTQTFARTPSSYQHVYDALYNRRRRQADNVEVKPKFKIGDSVRILKKKKTFEKGFTPNWTKELFIVSAVRLTKHVIYNIKDLKGESIRGAFYQQELQEANQEVTMYRGKEKGVTGRKKHL